MLFIVNSTVCDSFRHDKKTATWTSCLLICSLPKTNDIHHHEYIWHTLFVCFPVFEYAVWVRTIGITVAPPQNKNVKNYHHHFYLSWRNMTWWQHLMTTVKLAMQLQRSAKNCFKSQPLRRRLKIKCNVFSFVEQNFCTSVFNINKSISVLRKITKITNLLKKNVLKCALDDLITCC